MGWYDWFATGYDGGIEWVYRSYRADLAARAGLRPGHRVLDLACGTGPNLPHLVSGVGPAGTVVATDFSGGMLARARRRCERAGWENVVFVEKDARALTASEVGTLDAVVCTLGLSVIPDCEGVMEATFALLRPGGRYVVFDIHAEKRVLTSPWVELVAQADLARKPWTTLERLGADVHVDWLPGAPIVHGGKPFVAVAAKPAAA